MQRLRTPLLCLLVAGALIAGCTTIKPPVAWYPFDGNAKNIVGNKNHGTVYGAALTVDRFGKSGQAYSFNGIDNYIRLAKASDLGLTNSSLSISAWFNVKSFQPENHGDQAIVANDVFNRKGGCLHLVIRSDGVNDRQPFFNFYFDGADQYSQTHIEPGRWYHIVVSYDKAKQTKYIYLDGRLDTESPGCIPYVGTDYLNVGRYAGGYNSLGNSHFTGDIDDVRIYDRALDLKEVQFLFHEK